MKICRQVISMALAAVLAGAAGAGIVYDRALDAIWLTDFPEVYPCTLRLIRDADALNNWGRVAHDPAKETYALSCNLLIGANNGTVTYLQIGTAAHPGETLVMRGNVYVMPSHIEGENEGVYWRARIPVNRLRLGAPDDPAIRAQLKFECARPGEFGLFTGRLPAGLKKTGRLTGGRLHVFQGAISALRPGTNHAWSASFMGDGLVLDGANLSWGGRMLHGAQDCRPRGEYLIRNCVFEHAQWGLENGPNILSGCAFRDFETVVMDYGSIDATFVDCVFENNRRNWHLRTTDKGVVLIDCAVDRPGRDDLVQASRTPPNRGMVQSKRHAVVEIVSADGKPVAGARVVIRCEQGLPETVAHWRQTTDDYGRTPGRGDPRAVLLTEYTWKMNLAPEHYSYMIEAVSLQGGTAKVGGIRADQSWKIIRVVMPEGDRSIPQSQNQ